MSNGTSASTGKSYGLQRVCRVLELPRSTIYAARARAAASVVPVTGLKRGPKPKVPDADLLQAIRADLAASPFTGEGSRKVWARLRILHNICASRTRVLRLIREVHRNTDPEFRGLYSARRADTLAQTRRQQASSAKTFLQITPNVQTHIREQLAVHTSPEVISGVLRLKHGLAISKNTIYRYMQRDRQAGGTLYRQLPHHGKRYRYQAGNTTRSLIHNRVGIEQRPPQADLKQQPGHFEIDTVFGKDQQSFLLTLADKATKAIIIRKMPDKRAETVVATFQQIVDSTLYDFKTLTSDNGTEFAAHEQITRITGAPVSFANPYHSWERGLNEHSNGLIRRFYPKGTDFNAVSDSQIDALEHTLNIRGRKSLGFRSPNEVFLDHLRSS